MSQHTVTCPRCGGSGQAAIDTMLQVTLDALADSSPATSTQIHERITRSGLRTKRTATINKLTRLIHMGFVERKGKSGSAWLYHIK